MAKGKSQKAAAKKASSDQAQKDKTYQEKETSMSEKRSVFRKGVKSGKTDDSPTSSTVPYLDDNYMPPRRGK